MDIYVASESIHKCKAVKEAAGIVFPSDQGHAVRGMKAASGINEQPVGHEETLQGAVNRLADLVRILGSTKYDLAVALEGGIFSVKSNGVDEWYDCGWVVAQDAAGRRAQAHCAGLQFPTADVEEARRLGFDRYTVGSVIAKRAGADGTDPQSYLSAGLITRADVLRQACVAALGQMKPKA